MSETAVTVEFRNLDGQPIERGLAWLLESVLADGRRAVVVATSPMRVEALDRGLWTFSNESFLPHGSAAEGRPERQPVWLTEQDENPNGAAVAILVDGAEIAAPAAFERCIHLFDARDPPAREASRLRWKQWTDTGAKPSYWACSPGGWTKQR